MTDSPIQQVTKCSMTCQTKELLETLKFLSTAIPKKKNRTLYNIEITVKTNQVDFVVIGASRVIYCNAIGPVKVSLPFWYLNDIVQRFTAQYINFDITEGFLTIGKLTVEADTCFIQDDSILRSIKLPMNFTVADLLRLNDRYTPEEIAFNKLDLLIKKNIQTIGQDIDKIAVVLKKYGINRKEIQQFVYEKINYQTPTNHEK